MRLLILFTVLYLLLGGGEAQAFSYSTGGCATSGCAAGESWTFNNANEIATGLTNTENTVASIQAVTVITRASTSAYSGEFSLGSLTTGLLLNTSDGTTGTLTKYVGTTASANQVITALDASGAATSTALTTSYLPSGAALDAESTEVCLPTQIYIAPTATPTFTSIGGYGADFATTITRYRAWVMPTTSTATVTIRLQDCTAGEQSCSNADTAYTANSDGATYDTSISGASIVANHSVSFAVTATTGDPSQAALKIELCYSRQVVQ